MTLPPAPSRPKTLRALVAKWRDAAVWEHNDMSNTQSAATFDQCADELESALAGPQEPSGLEAKVREWFDAMDAADEPRDVKSDTPLDLVAHVEKVGRLRDEVRAILGLPASPAASTEPSDA